MTGIIVKNISNDYTISSNGNYYTCKPRGKFRLNGLIPLVGDIVEFDILGNFPGGKVAMIIDNGHLGCRFVIQHFGDIVAQQEMLIHKRTHKMTLLINSFSLL